MAHQRGRVRVDADGNFYARETFVDPLSGESRREYKRFTASGMREAQRQCDEWMAQRDGPSLVSALRRYVQRCRLYGTPKSGRASANTVAAYSAHVRRVESALGDVPLALVSPATVSTLYMRLMDSGLAPATVANLHWFLCGAYKWMVSSGLVSDNPMPSTDHPAQGGAEAQALAPEEYSRAADELRYMIRYADTAKDVACAAAAFVALCTGLRRAEVCGLRRRDLIEGETPLLIVAGQVTTRGRVQRVGTPKTRSGHRVVALTPWELGELREALARTPATGELDGPLLTWTGRFMNPDTLGRWFNAHREQLGLPDWAHMHSLRHTYATTLLAGGVSMRDVQVELGHANAATTIGTYGHAMAGAQARSAAVMGDALRAASGGSGAAAEGGGRRG